MTAIERFIARVGIAGLLAILLAASVAVNTWLIRRAGHAAAACEARIAALAAEVQREATRAESLSLRIGRETAERAEADAAGIRSETVRYVERIREIRIPVPAECHRDMPLGVRDTLADAARAANRRL